MNTVMTRGCAQSADRARLLLVDDEPFNLEILAEHLDDARYDTVQACNGAEAWQLLDADPAGFDLVLLDRMMPIMNGMELLTKVRADARFAALPIVMQTAAAAKEQVAEGLRQGAHYYLTKPFEREVLLAIVEAALEQRRNRIALVDDRPDPRSLVAAEFEFRTLAEARRLAGFLAGACPEPGQVVLGLTELMINAIEHGNLGITYREKSDLNERCAWRDEVERRLALPEYAGRRALVKVARTDSGISFIIEDEGAGFNWQRYMEMDPERAFDSHGRGIAMSRMVSFSVLEYLGRGNVVRATVASRPIP
ncbi:MAG: response regulator [Burkholderiales bacterium]|nr:response regulator [Burkholderiales bacterium]